jgi:hypothetical protein
LVGSWLIDARCYIPTAVAAVECFPAANAAGVLPLKERAIPSIKLFEIHNLFRVESILTAAVRA